MKPLYLILLGLSGFTASFGQSTRLGCTFTQRQPAPYSDKFSPAAPRILEMVDAILKKSNMNERNFEIFQCQALNNCMVTQDEQGVPILLYDDAYLSKVRKNFGFDEVILENTNEYWAVLSILAHEVGHILQLHFIGKNKKDDWTCELQADNFMGSVLFRLGATLEQAQSGLELYLINAESSKSHPAKATRLKECAKGWQKAQASEIPTTIQDGLNAYWAKDYEKAFQILSRNRQSADFDGKTAYCLATLYKEGRGTLGSKTKAFELYKVAAEKGDMTAQQIIAFTYLEKNWVQEATEWFLKAATLGAERSQYELARLYEAAGKTQAAREWYVIAAKNHYLAAQRRLNELGITW